eukprot:gene5682-6264_t
MVFKSRYLSLVFQPGNGITKKAHSKKGKNIFHFMLNSFSLFKVVRSLKYFPFLIFSTLVIYLYLTLLLRSSSSLFESSPYSAVSSQHLSLRSSSSSTTIPLFAKASPLSNMSTRVASSIPTLLYGTAWKKERTAQLVEEAIRTGFRAVDTACQPKHYNEKGVGDALERLYASQIVTREDLFLQTKFTSLSGQDPLNIPYDQTASLDQQVRQSVQKSCENLKTSYLDSVLLHSPMRTVEDTLTVWRVLEEFHHAGVVRHLGLSNTYNLQVLQAVYDAAEVKPSFLQNRFYRENGYDVEIRKYCDSKNIRYQSFWTLTGNPLVLRNAVVQRIGKKHNKSAEEIFYKFVQSLGIIILDGTTSRSHMIADLNLHTFHLDEMEREEIRALLW